MADLTQLKTILIADDHNLFRQGLKLVFQGLIPDVDIVEAGNMDEAADILDGEHVVDLALLDLAMPGMDLHDRLPDVCRNAAPVPVVILSAFQDQDGVRAALEAGARGYLLKAFSEESLRHALGLILSGEVYVPSSILAQPSEGGAYSAEMSVEARQRPHRRVLSEGSPLSALTPRQYDVLMLIMQGQSNKEIGRTLGVYESTVKAHIQVILQKLKADNRTHAAMIAREWAPQSRSEQRPPG